MQERVRVTADQMDSQCDETWGDWEAYVLEHPDGIEKALLDLYQSKLDDPEIGENDLQAFLERYPWLIPAPF